MPIQSVTSISPQAAHRVSFDARQSLRSQLTSMIAEALAERQLSQVDAARMCDTDQPTLSKILAGRKQNASSEKLLCWLMALGWDVEIRLKRSAGVGKPGVMLDE
ncbi:XRE family transcriptional regulator [Rhizobium leguminosarum]|uniref:XRE family transcriptional regulator n=1 Tax=Rhizobium leguminosarum TaxID=384 RepID=UPI0019FB0AD0|nr:XRE family transcriptional regulator [Rhizobium leguminosarum]NKJ82569.1 helix-turn-helix domain-containing protein [Rhizobium leguminosarum bv. viciae]